MQKTDIIAACQKTLPTFTQTLTDETYQLRGILNSEALLITALAEHFGVKHIIESGRARGHSTNLLAKHFTDTDVHITSIDLDKRSPDARYSEQHLQQYDNLTLLYGDSFTLIPQQVTQDCVVFIDGPKGEPALGLVSDLLQDKHVKAVMVHDLHKNTFPRNISELIYTDTFFSDDDAFVAQFKQLDDDCWRVMEGTGYTPYVRAGQPVASYGHTLGVYLNSAQPFNQPVHDNYITHKKDTRPTISKLLQKKFFSLVHWLRLQF